MTPRKETASLRVEGIVKTFPGVKALKGVTLECRPGEIQALVGENGAGKSTLMRVLTGVHQPNEGRIEVDGETVRLTSPRMAADLGIAMVYQDTKLVPDLDAAQNIFLGREPGGALLDLGRMRSEATNILKRLGERFDMSEATGAKPLAERQTIEIARGLSNDAQVLIFDEPTSALSPWEVDRLFDTMRELRDAGKAIVFISHRLPEVFAISDRITVLKDGEMVGTVNAAEADEDQIIRMMVGRELSMTYPPRNDTPGETVLSVSGLKGEGFDEASFEVGAGEILGLGGIAGSGQQNIVRALFGLIPGNAGSKDAPAVEIDGAPVKLDSPEAAIRAGIVYLPSDRRGEGMFLPHSIADNITLPHIRDWARLGILDNGRAADVVDDQIAKLNIRTPSPDQPVGLLSGGNQQKVTFARWLLSEPRVCILDEPTQGVDVGAKIEIYQLIRDLSARGIAVIVVSSDVMELIGISDRILVVAEGRVVGEMPAAEATEEKIIGAAVRADTRSHKQAAGKEPSAENKPARRRNSMLQRYGAAGLLLVLLAAAVVFTSLSTPYFLTSRNMSSLAIQIAPLVIAAIGQFAVIMLGGIDLSAGPNISLSTAIASFLIVSGAPFGIVPGIIAVLLAGIAVGLVNALLIQGLRLPDLVATLATFSAVAGVALIVRPAPGGLVDFDFADAILMEVMGVPVAFIIAVALVLLIELALLRGRIGLRLIATGSDQDAAFVAGVPTSRIRFGAYMFCGFMASVAGLIVAARIGSGDPQAGTNFTLLTVTAVVVGGTSVFGGKGTAIGVFLACCLLMVIQNAMNHLQVTAYWQYVLTGGLTLLAVAIYTNSSAATRKARAA